ncbi:lytic polysaccharide monooxygenase, partial [Streptomyces pathocidini]|uniref:lytic polysaccharide monooxygenase n=1 Tax=Streptomyces pathocidini TaxID=1650571 RepID=UPI0033D8CA71
MNTKRAMIGATVVAATVGSVFLSSASAFAHGLVTPDNRYGTGGTACAAGSTSGGDLKGRQVMPKNIQNGLVGQALYEPQSLEGPASWDDGKLDGKIPSGGWSAGVAHRLNEQTPTLWEKQEFQQGQTVTAGWCFAAPHSTKNFEYFITKNGWDPNKPLTRDSFERAPLTTVNGNNAMPVTGLHQIKLPADRTGYHIILSKWNIGDTSMAFYNVSDLNIKGGEAIEKPSTPSGLHHMGVTASQVKLMWNASDRATAYEILRNNQTIAEIPSTAGVVEYADTQVSPNTDYVYKVRAVNSAGVSDYSNALNVKTPDGPSQSKPSVSQAWLVKKDNGQTLVSVKGKGTPGSQVFVK